MNHIRNSEDQPQRLNTNNESQTAPIVIEAAAAEMYSKLFIKSAHYKELANQFYFEYLSEHYFGVLFLALFTAHQLNQVQLPYQVSFCVLWVQDLHNIYQTRLTYLRSQQSFRIHDSIGTKCKTLVYENVISIITKIMIVSIVEIDRGSYYLIIIPTVLMFLLRIRIYLMEKDEIECFSLINFTMIGSRVFLIMGTICICMKLDGFSMWSWKEVFWWYWVYLSICVGIAFAVVLMTVSKTIQLIIGDQDAKIQEIKASFWCSLVCICICVSSCLWVTGTIDTLDSTQQTPNQTKLIALLLFLAIHTLIFTIITICWKPDIEGFLTHMIINEDTNNIEISPDLVVQLHQNNTIPIPKPKQKIVERQKFQIPKLLKRLSATYFGIANPQEQEALQLKLQEKKEAKNRKIKIDSQGTNVGSREYMLQKKSNAIVAKKSAHALKLSKTYQAPQQDDIFIFDIESNEGEEHKRNQIDTSNEKHGNILLKVNEEGSVVKIHQQEQGQQKYGQPYKINDTVCQFSARASNEPIEGGYHRRCISENVPKQIKSESEPGSSREINQSQAQQGEQSMSQISRVNNSVQNCLVCFDKAPDAVFMLCGHGGLCYECSLDIWKNSNECYLCRDKIVQVLQLDLSSKQGLFLKVISSTQMVNDL